MVYSTIHTTFHRLRSLVEHSKHGAINIWTVISKSKEVQPFLLFCNSAHSIGDLILNYGSKYQKVMTTWKCMSPAQTSPLNSRLIYPTACLTSPLGSLITITDIQVPNGTPDLTHAPLPSSPQKMTIPFFQLLSPLFSLSLPLFEQKILLVTLFNISTIWPFLTIHPVTPLVQAAITVVSNWPPCLCLWYLAVHVYLSGQNLSCQTFNKSFSCLSEEKPRSSQWPGDLTVLALSHDFMVTSIIFNSA